MARRGKGKKRGQRGDEKDGGGDEMRKRGVRRRRRCPEDTR